MKILLQEDRTGVLEVADLPPPLLKAGGVLVRTAFSLISAGTERSTRELARKSLIGKAIARPDQVRKVLEVAKREGIAAARERVSARLDVMRPLGYSSAGTVFETGTEASGDFLPGQRVACAGGGYAVHSEIVYIPKNLCVSVPDSVELDQAAFTTVGAIALQGVRQAEVQVGERVAVIGLGLVGQLTAQILRAAGCSVVGIDVSQHRCSLAEELGADLAIVRDDESLNRVLAFAPDGVDAVIITAATQSSDPIAFGAEICRDRARVVIVGAVGMTVPREPFYRKELDLRLSRSYGPGRYDTNYEERGQDYPIGYVRWTEKRNMQAFLELLAKGTVRVAPLITHRFSLERAEAAYAAVEGRSGSPSLGVLFSYPQQIGSAERRVRLPQPSISSDRQRFPGIGLIGAGNYASGVLLPTLQRVGSRQIRFCGVGSASGITARTVGKRFGFAFCASHPADVIADPDTDAVVIATRHDQHADLTIETLAARKAVFVEKPLALTVEDVHRVVAAEAQAQRPVLVGFNRRFSPLTQAIHEHFRGRSEPLVMIARVNAGYVPHDHWTQDPSEGGGRILGEACHFVDLLHYLAASPPVELVANVLPDGARYHGDNVCATIRFADGSTGTVLYFANGDPSLPKERIEVSGNGRSAVIDDFREAVLYEDRKARRIRLSRQDKGHSGELAAFISLIKDGTPTVLPFHEAVLSTLATLAIPESARTRMWVPIAYPQIRAPAASLKVSSEGEQCVPV